MALECTSAHQNIGINNFEGKFMKCCSNHAAAFTVMEKELLEVKQSSGYVEPE